MISSFQRNPSAISLIMEMFKSKEFNFRVQMARTKKSARCSFQSLVNE